MTAYDKIDLKIKTLRAGADLDRKVDKLSTKLDKLDSKLKIRKVHERLRPSI